MKKRVIVLSLLIISTIASIAILSACGNGTRTIYFDKQSYEIYLDEGAVFTPTVTTSPRGKDYILTSSNETLLKVNEDGKSVTALKKDSVAYLTATSDKQSATAKVLIFSGRASASAPNESDDRYLVYFLATYGSVVAQRVEPGELATEPVVEPYAGYKLFGWYLDMDRTIPYDFSTPVTSDLYLYDWWGPDEPEFEVTYVDNEPYISGFKYKTMPYEDISLPTIDASNNVIVGIQASAFAENASITSVTIPSGYRTIGDYAFNQCSSLKSVDIGEDIVSIGSNAFADCTSLTDVTFTGNTLTAIGSAAFIGCEQLLAAPLPDSVSSIGIRAFKECSSLAEVHIPSALRAIPAECFAYTALTSIDLKDITTIYNRAFWGATGLTTVTGGDALTDVGEQTFGSLSADNILYSTEWLVASGVEDVVAGQKSGKVTYLGNILLYVHGVSTKPRPIYVRAGTTSIAGQAFADVQYAIAIFPTDAPPTYGSNAFGVNSPSVDIIVQAGAVENFTRSWLVTTLDAEGYYVPNAYSLALIQKIYSVTNAAFEGRVYYRYPLKPLDDGVNSGVYFSKLAAHEADDPYAGISYNADYVYYLLDSYTGASSALDMNAYISADQAARGESRTAFLEKVAAYAINANESLARVILPNRTLKIESYAIGNCSGLTALYMSGASAIDEGKTFVAAAVTRLSISLTASSFKIYVSEALYKTYRSAWGAVGLSAYITSLT